MPAIRYLGYFAEESGYGVAARNHALALARTGVRVLGKGVLFRPTTGFFDAIPERSVSPRLHRLCRRVGPYDTVLVHAVPVFFPQLREPRKRNIGLAAWEADRLPRPWRPPARAVDEIWVPSKFSVEAFHRATGKPVHVVPHPVGPPPPFRKAFPGIPDDAFVFVNVLEWQERKNPLGIVKAFGKAFQGRSDVMLVFKIGRRLGLDERRVLAGIDEALPRFFAPRVTVFFADDTARSVVARLLRRADAYVSLHRAEGFGLCMAEAMAAGVPVIATGYSGNLEYMDHRSAFLVGHRMIPIVERLAHGKFYEADMQWADPKLDEAVDALRACAFEPTKRRTIARAGEERVRRELSLRAVGTRMKTLLGMTPAGS